MFRGKLSWVLLAMVVCALLVLPAAKLQASDEGGEHSSSEMGPETLFGKFADSAIWTIVVFLVLLLVLGKYAWKPLLEGLEKREHSIHKALADAKKAHADAEELRAKHQLEMSRAQEQVRAILEEGRRNAQQAADDMIARARAESQAERDRVRREMEIAHEQALQQLTDWAAQLATMISAKALMRQISLDDHRRLVDEALTEMRRTNGTQQRQTA